MESILTTKRPIFASKDPTKKIDYLDGGSAYDLSDRLRCNYSEDTGNLSDPATAKIVGHVSLDGKFIGLSWLAAELFPAPAVVTQSSTSSDQATNQCVIDLNFGLGAHRNEGRISFLAFGDIVYLGGRTPARVNCSAPIRQSN